MNIIDMHGINYYQADEVVNVIEQLKNELESRVKTARYEAMGCTYIACCEELDKDGDPRFVGDGFFDNIQESLAAANKITEPEDSEKTNPLEGMLQ